LELLLLGLPDFPPGIPYQLIQLVSERQAIMQVVPKGLVELAPSVLARPQPSTNLWGWL